MPADEELLKKDNAIEKRATDLSQALRKTGYPGGQHNIKRHSILQNKGNAILKMQWEIKRTNRNGKSLTISSVGKIQQGNWSMAGKVTLPLWNCSALSAVLDIPIPVTHQSDT